MRRLHSGEITCTSVTHKQTHMVNGELDTIFIKNPISCIYNQHRDFTFWPIKTFMPQNCFRFVALSPFLCLIKFFCPLLQMTVLMCTSLGARESLVHQLVTRDAVQASRWVGVVGGRKGYSVPGTVTPLDHHSWPMGGGAWTPEAAKTKIQRPPQ